MSQTVEERVARFDTELTFNNSQFESAAQTSISTLGKLKEALNFKGAEKSFEEIGKAAGTTNIDKIAAGVDQLTKRFSVMGIVGMTNIMDVTRAIRGKLTGAISTVTNKIIEGGKRRAMNVEQAKFLLQGLLDDSAEIEKVMQNAKDSVLDTAYGYDQAAMAAAQFATSGVKGGEDMARALSGVAGVAATTNSAYEGVSGIFTQVSGKSRLMGDELLQLSNLGLNAAAIIAKYFNNVQEGSVEASNSVKQSIAALTQGLAVTEADVREWTSRGKVTFEMFSNAMSESFGKHAKDANKTLTGVLSNVNARFSQIGEKFFTPLIQQEGPLVSFFNTVKDKLAEVRDNIDPLAKLFDGAVIKGLSSLQEKIQNIPIKEFFGAFNQGVFASTNGLSPFTYITKDVIDGLGLTEKQFSALGKTIRAVAREHKIDIDGMMKADGKFIDTLQRGWLTFDIFKEAIDRVFGAKPTEETVNNANAIREAALAVIRGDYGNDAERIAKLTEEGFDAQAVQDYVNAIHEAAGGTWNYTEAMLDAIDAEYGNIEAISSLSDEQLKALGYTEDQIQGMKELAKIAEETGTPLNDLLEKAKDPFFTIKLLIESASNVLSNFSIIATAAKNAFAEVFPPVLSTQITAIILKINSLSKGLVLNDKSANRIQRTFRGVFSVLKILGTVLLSVGKVALPLVFKAGNAILSAFLAITATIGDFLFELSNAITESNLFDKILSPIANDLSGLGGIIGFIASKIGGLFSIIANFVREHSLISGFVNIIAGLADAAGKFRVGLGDLLKGGTSNKEATGVSKLAASMSNLGSVIKTKLVTPAIEKFTKFLTNLNIKLPETKGSMEGVKKAFSRFAEILAKVVDTIANKLDSIDFGKYFGEFGTAISNAVRMIYSKISSIDFGKIFGDIQNFINNIKTKYATPALDKILEFAEKVKQHIPTFSELVSTISNFISAVTQNAAIPTFESIKTFVDSLIQNGPSIQPLVTFFQDLLKVVQENFKMPGFESFVEIVQKLREYIPDLTTLSNVTGAVATAAGQNFSVPGFLTLNELLERIKNKTIVPLQKKIEEFKRFVTEKWNMPGMDKVRWAFDEIRKIIKNLDPDTVYLWVDRITRLLTLLAVKKTVESIGKQFKTLADAWAGVGKAFKDIAGTFSGIGKALSGGITKMFDSISKTIDTFKTGLRVNMILKIAIAIGIVAAAMWVLSKIPEEKYAQIAELLLDIALALSIVYVVITICNTLGDPGGAARNIVAFAAAMVLIAEAIKRLKELSPEQIIYGAVAMGALMVVMAICMQAFRELSSGVTDLVAPFSLVIALGLLMLEVVALSVYINGHEDAVRKAMDATQEMMVTLALCLQGFRSLHAGPADLVAPFSIVLALLLLALDIIVFAKIPDTWYQLGYERILVIGGLLVAAVEVMKIGKGSIASVLTPLTLVTALIFLALEIVIFAKIPNDMLIKGGQAVVSIMFFLAAATGLMNFMSGFGSMSLAAVLAPITLVIAIGLLAGEIIKLGKIGATGELEYGFQAVAWMGLLLVGLFGLMGVISNFVTLSPAIILAPLAVVIALGLLCAEIIVVGKLTTQDEMNRSLGIMAAAAIALVGVSTLMSEVKVTPGLIVAPILFVIAMGVLMAEMVVVGYITTGDVVNRAQTTMITACLALITVSYILSNINVGPGMIVGPLVLIATLFVIIEAIRQLGTMKEAEFSQGLSGFAVGIILIAAAFAVLAACSKVLDTVAMAVIKVAAGAVIFAAALVVAAVGASIFSFAMQQFGQFEWQQIIAALGGVALVILALGVAAAIGGAMALPLAGAFLAVGAGALMLAVALSILAGTMPVIVEHIKSLGASFAQAGANIAQGAANGILAGGKAFIGNIANMAVNGFHAFCDFFGINSPSLLMTAAGANISLGAANGVNAGAPVAVESMTTMGGGMLESFGNKLFGAGGIFDLSSKIPWLAKQGVEGNEGEATKAIDDLINQMSNETATLPGEVGSAIEQNSGEAQDAMAQLNELINGGLNTEDLLAKYGDFGSLVPTTMGENIEQNSGEAENAMSKLNDLMNGEFDMDSMLEQYGLTGEMIPTTMGEGVLENSEVLNGNFEEMMSSLGDYGIDIAGGEKFKDIGKTFDLSEASGIKANASKIKDAAKDAAKKGAQAAKDTKDKWVDVGEALSDGLAKGVSNHSDKIKDAARSAAKKAYEAAKNELKVNSPSKKFITLGESIDEGFIVGIERGEDSVIKASKNVAKRLVLSSKKTIDMLADLMNSDIMDDPVLTPVLDLSEIQNGSKKLFSMMSEMDRYSLHGNVDLATSTSRSVDFERKTRQDREDDILSALIDGLKEIKKQNDTRRGGDTYIIDGITYDDGSNVSSAIGALIRAAKVGGRA